MQWTTPSPDLPTELTVQIMDFAAQGSFEAAQSISLVSTWARGIALPHLFSTVVIRFKPAYSMGMASGARDSPHARMSRPQAWGHLVRNLWVESSGIANAPKEEEILRACLNLENIALKSLSLRTLPSSLKHSAVSPTPGWTPDEPRDPPRCYLRSVTLITHTLRYEWHSLANIQLRDGTMLLHNITHLHLLEMTISSFSPHDLLPNLTHLALPYLDLGNDFRQDNLRLPVGVLEHRSLKMIVLTVTEGRWLTNPWYQISRYPGKATNSPRAAFCHLVDTLRKRDDRLHAVLSPRLGVDPCEEWANAARGGPSLWGNAAQARLDRSCYGADLPDTYPKEIRR
ncbi:hypothetical protein C8Q80DRAFT_1098065 [Daedaleopsis nitida]|nr:hypothetical protein C8Q80DRAFT_1098065 [Daedaleopsis nitida]